MTMVMSYDDGGRLDGDASEELIRESAEAAPTGAVPAYLDSDGTWQYVPPSMVDQYRHTLGLDIVTVWVES